MSIRTVRILLILALATLLAACGSSPKQDGPPRRRINVSKISNPTPRVLPKSRYGNPSSYVALGKRYYVLPSAAGYQKRGIASWYGRKFHGRLTSSREPYNMYAMTAASPVLPLPTFARVTNLENGRSIVVKVNDRGPFAANRIIDLSYAAAIKLGYARKGTALVEVDAINPRRPQDTPPIFATRHPQLYLQLGAFSNYENAERLKSRVREFTNRHVVIKTGSYHDEAIYRVQIGPLIGVGESDRLHQELQEDGLGEAFTVIG